MRGGQSGMAAHGFQWHYSMSSLTMKKWMYPAYYFRGYFPCRGHCRESPIHPVHVGGTGFSPDALWLWLALCVLALRSIHANEPLILDDQVLIAALWPLEAVAWLLGDSGDGALEILDCTSRISWGSRQQRLWH